MLWFNRAGIGLAIILTAGTGLLYWEGRGEAIAERAEITATNAECAHSKRLNPKLSDDAFSAALTCGGSRETPPSIPTLQNAGAGWLSAMAWAMGIWLLLWVFDFVAGGNERRSKASAKSKSVA